MAHVCQHMNLRVVLRSGIGDPRNSEAVDDIEQRDKDLDFPSVTENRETQGRPRGGKASQKASSESADQVVVNYHSGAGPATTP